MMHRPQVVDEVGFQHGGVAKACEQQQVIEQQGRDGHQPGEGAGAPLAPEWQVPAPQNSSTSLTSTSGETLVIREVSAAREAHNKMVSRAKPVDLSHQEDAGIQHSFAR
jgi:hypothetical protein